VPDCVILVSFCELASRRATVGTSRLAAAGTAAMRTRTPVDAPPAAKRRLSQIVTRMAQSETSRRSGGIRSTHVQTIVRTGVHGPGVHGALVTVHGVIVILSGVKDLA